MVTVFASFVSIMLYALLDDQKIPFTTSEIIDTAINTAMAENGAVGIGVGLVENGEVKWLKGYGFADRENGIPVDPQRTQFRWASISKPVTAIAAIQLVEQQKLDLDLDVRVYVPEFPDKGAKITTRQLLCHQGGIVHYSNGKVVATVVDYAVDHPFQSVVTSLDKFKDSPLIAQPGEQYSYSTHGYVLLSAVVERAGEKPYAEQVTERIAKPLRMDRFRPDYEWENIPDRAVGYRREGDVIERRPDSENEDVSWKLGGGGWTSTTEDLAKFTAGLQTQKLVTKESRDLMWQVKQPRNTKGAKPYGLGFFVLDRPNDRLIVGHDGKQAKTRTSMMLAPASDRGIVVMTNSEWFDPVELTIELLDKLETNPRSPKQK